MELVVIKADYKQIEIVNKSKIIFKCEIYNEI